MPSPFDRSRSVRPLSSRRRGRRLAVEGLEARSLLTTLIALTSQDVLLTFSDTSPATIQRTTAVTGLASGESLVSIAERPSTGVLFGLGTQSHLYTINPSTGVAAIVSASAFSPSLVGSGFGFDVNPVTDLARIVDDSGQNLRLSPTTGMVTNSDGLLGYATGDPHAGVAPNVVAIASTNHAAGATSTTVYGIDSSLSTLVRLGAVSGSPVAPELGQVFTVGALGVTVQNSIGFTSVPGATGDQAFAALTPVGSTATSLYTVDLATGSAHLVGAIGGGSATIVGLAAVPAQTINQPPGAPTLAASSDSGQSNTDHITNVKTPIIQGVALPNMTVQIQANGVVVGQTATDAAGNYSVTIGPLADGSYQIQAAYVDAMGVAGLTGPAMAPPLVIDTVAPTAPGAPTLFTQLDTGFSNTDNFTRINSPQFFGDGIAGDAVTLYLNGSPVTTGTVTGFGQYAVQTDPLTNGQYQVTATQSDVAGNVSPMSGALNPALVIDNSSRPAPDQAFVGQLYHDLLGRPADQQALLIWSPLVSQPNGRTTVVRGILGSNEYRLFLANQINSTVLHLSAPASTLIAGANYLANHSPQQYKAMLVGTPSYFASVGGTNTAFIQSLYLNLLGRPVDAYGLTFGNAFLNAKGASRELYAYRLLTSPEGYAKSTTDIYQNLLHFAPDGASLNASIAQYQRGGQDADLIANLTNTDIYYRQSRGSDLVLNQWEHQAFLDLLGRPADQNFLNTANYLINQGKTPQQVAQLVQTSSEYQARQINNTYSNVLHRLPTPAELAAATQSLGSGGTIEALRGYLYGGNEYFTNNGGTNSGFVSALFLDTLGRPADPTSLSLALQTLNSGTTRLGLASYLVNSVEGTQHTIQGIYLTILRRVPSFTELSSNSALLSAGAIRDQDIVASLIGSSEYFSRL